MKKFNIIPVLFFLLFSFAFPQIPLGKGIEGNFDSSFGHSVSVNSDGSRLAIGAPGGGDSGKVRVYEYANNAWTQLGADIDGEYEYDWFGTSVSMSSDGSRLAIGAENSDANGENSGHVRVYEYANNAWTQLGANIDGEGYEDGSGYVSMNSDGSRLAIGAPGNDGNGGNSGHVRVYEYANNAWTQLGADIDGEAAGASVSMSSDGSRLAIGADGNNGNGENSGHVRVYEYANNAWTQLGADIDGEYEDDLFGHSVSMNSDGSRVSIGAPKNDGNGKSSGHVRVYEYSNNAWIQLGADIDGATASDESGTSVSLSSDGSRVAIGAPHNNGNGYNSGQVRIYDYINGTWTKVGTDINYLEETSNGYSVSLSSDGSTVAMGMLLYDMVLVYDLSKINDPLNEYAQLGADITGEREEDYFGRIVSLSSDGSRVAISNSRQPEDSGYIVVYEYSNSAWSQLGDDITNSEATSEYFGGALSLSSDGSRVAIGDPHDDGDGGYDNGQVRIYEYSNGAWSQLGDALNYPYEDSNFGSAVSLSSDGSRVAIGIPYQSAVSVYEYSNGTWSQLGGNIDGEDEWDLFGYSVSISSDGSRLAIGAPDNESYGGEYSGAVYLYEYSNSRWRQLGSKIDGLNEEDNFGYSVSINSDGSRMAISAPWSAKGGDVKLYEYSNGAWSQFAADIFGEYGLFGLGGVSINSDGSRVAIGNPAHRNDDGKISGAVQVYSSTANTGQGPVTFQPQTKEELQTAVDLWVSDNATALSTYGEINTWDVSLITDMSNLFKGKSKFNDDISDWDVSKVTNMKYLFSNASSYNQDLSSWDVSSVTTMVAMFAYASSFNQDISSWDVSNVETTAQMFIYASSFNQDISSWDVSNVINMFYMFLGADALSDENKCAIHTSFQSNNVWYYDWSDLCTMSDHVLSFDGKNDYVDIPDMVAPSGNAPRTFMAWIKRDDTSTSWPGQAIGGWGNDKNNELMNIMVLDSVLNWHLHGQNTLTGSAQIRPDTWYHIAATYDSTTQRFYVDGLLDGSNDRILNTGSGNVKIGRQPDYNGAYFSGDIDEVTIFDRALTQEEIQNSISHGLPMNNDGLLGYWKFNAGTDTIAYDHSANANHGVINGAAWVDNGGPVIGCTDSLAANYNSDANYDDGSCSGYPVNGNFNISFDGVDDYVNLPDLSYMNDLSFSAWYKIDTRDTWERIFDFGKGGTGDIFLTTKGGRTGGDLELTIHSSGKTYTIDPGITTDDGNWHHVVFTYDKGGSGMTLYVDGQNKGSNEYNTNSLSDFGSGQKFYLAKSNWNDAYYDGQMGEVGLYNKALSADEVTSIYTGGSNFDLNTNFGKYVSESNLIGYWKFDAGTDTIAYDHSGYANHAAINGATWIKFDDSTSTGGLDKYKSPISLNPYPSSIESDDYTIDANGILDKPIDWSFPAISDTGDIIEFIVGSDWHSKRPKDLQILYGKKVVAIWTHPSKASGGCAKDLEDYIQNGLTISASDCDTSTSSFSTGVLKMKLDISEADSLKLRILSAWGENGILFDGAWIRTGNYSDTESSALYVAASGSDLKGDGTSGSPFYTIQKAINHSKDGDSVLVTVGIYKENIDFTGKNISIIGANKNKTIIDGDSSGTVVLINSGEDSTAIFTGFTIRNGINTRGGGMQIRQKSNPVIKNVIVTANRSHLDGGGIYVNNAKANISNVIIKGNNSDGVAGGFYAGEGAEVTISNSQITNNVSAVRGGGIWIRKHTTSINLKHTLISHNLSNEGGGIGSWYGSSNLENITIFGNTTTTNRGNAILLRESSEMVLTNSIVMGNDSNLVYLEHPESSLSATYSLIENGWVGEGNIDVNPLFCDQESNDFTLWENSPCLGTGKNGANMGAFAMGCDVLKSFEWISSASDTINITKENLSDVYNLQWKASKKRFGNVRYKLSASLGVFHFEEFAEITDTIYSITYQDFLDSTFAYYNSYGNAVNSLTCRFTVIAIEGQDTVKITGDPRIVYVNRYDYLSTASYNIPEKFELYNNYPNPFNPTTTLRFDLPEVSNVHLTIYNMLGQKIKSFNMEGISAGSHSVTWNANNDHGDPVGAGVYLYQLRAKDFVKTRKMVLLK